MAQQQNLAAKLTGNLPGIPSKAGRPVSGRAMSNAQRQQKYRACHQIVETSDQMHLTVKRLADQFDLPESYIVKELIRFALCNKNWSLAGFPVVKRKA